jgi:hypothetical protein
MAQHQLAALQVATFGSEGQDGIALGIRSFPVHKLVIICFASDKNKAEEFARKIRNVLGLPVTINVVTMTMARKAGGDIMEVTGGSKKKEAVVTVSRNAWLTLTILSSTLLTVFFSETMLLPAIPEIIQDFNIPYGTAAWIFSA